MKGRDEGAGKLRVAVPTRGLGRLQLMTLSAIQGGTRIFKGARKDLDALLASLERRHLIRLETQGYVLTTCSSGVDWAERDRNWVSRPVRTR